jgi:trans-aconitate methyltransferase
VIRKYHKFRGHATRPDLTALIKKYAPGKSFADIGCMWGIDGSNSFLAERSGSTKVVGVDVYKESQNFLEAKKKTDSKVEFVLGDINSPETSQKIGSCDVVYCAGVLYHSPDPFHLLTRLRAICKETLILSTTCIPEVRGIRNAAIFYPFLNEKQRQIWNRGIGSQKAITGPYEPESGYANWFWGMTPSCIESLLQCAGFEIVERHVFPFDCAFVCRTVQTRFVAESGEWTTPKDPDYLKFRK